MAGATTVKDLLERRETLVNELGLIDEVMRIVYSSDSRLKERFGESTVDSLALEIEEKLHKPRKMELRGIESRKVSNVKKKSSETAIAKTRKGRSGSSSRKRKS